MSNLTNIQPFKELVRRTARAFYGDIGVNEWRFRNTKDNKETSFAEVVLNTLTRYEWVKEKELEKALRVCGGQLRPTLFFLKKEKLVKFEQKAEPVEVVRRLHAGATADAQHDGREEDEKTALIYRTSVLYTYWCLDYGQIYNVARYKIFGLKKQLKDELDSKNRKQEYSCPKCNKRYTALNASGLFSDDGENVLSDNCHGQLVVESDKLVAQAVANADNNVNCCEKLEEMLQKMEEQIMPLAKQLNRVKELAVPDFVDLEAREVEAATVFIDQGKIGGPVTSHIEQMKDLMQRINSSNKKSKMDITSEPSNNQKSSQDNHLHVPYHTAGLEVQGGQNTKKQQDPSNVHILGQPISSDHQQFSVSQFLFLQHMRNLTSGPSVNGKMSQGNHSRFPYYTAGLEVQQFQDSKKQQDPSNVYIFGQPKSSDHQKLGVNALTGSYLWQSKRNVTSGPSGNGENSQGNHLHLPHYAAGLEVKQEQDILGLPTTTTLDCHVGMKRKHGVNNIREVATPSGIIEEYCKVDSHIQTKDDKNDGWELVQHDLTLQFCRL